MQEVFFLLRIMMLKMASTVITEMWPRIWPHLVTELFQLFSPKLKTVKDPRLRVEGLKFLEMLSTLGIEEFQSF
jgi:hypothetical protein